MLRIRQHLVGMATFDHMSKVHYQDFIAQGTNHLHIVADK